MHERFPCCGVSLLVMSEQVSAVQLTSKHKPNECTPSGRQLRVLPATAFPFPLDSPAGASSPNSPVLTTFFSAPTPHRCPQTRSAVVTSTLRRARTKGGRSLFVDADGALEGGCESDLIRRRSCAGAPACKRGRMVSGPTAVSSEKATLALYVPLAKAPMITAVSMMMSRPESPCSLLVSRLSKLRD